MQLTRLNITALCHVKIKLEMVLRHDDCQFLVSIHLDEIKDLSFVFTKLLRWLENKLT